jgi:hypothetical protein
MFIRTKTDGVEIRAAVPLTTPKGKIRVKRRTMTKEYGETVITRQESLSQNCYIEWQIGYDVPAKEKEKLALTTLPDVRFTKIRKEAREIKALYELSEYVYWLAKWGLIAPKNLSLLATELATIPSGNLFEFHPDLSIKRSHPVDWEVNGTTFLFSRVEYPLIVHKFEQYEIIAEIITREKQIAVGVQPMLYLCFPITELVPQSGKPPLVGRKVELKEHADFVINKANAYVFFQLIRLFGMLSKNHRTDILAIIKTILARI